MFVLSTGHSVARGRGNQVLAGITDPERGMTAWVEEVTGELMAGYLPVEITISLAGRGVSPLRVPIATYNPYFGCDVHWMELSGGALVTVYTEKHQTIIARIVPPDERLHLLPADTPLVAEGGILCYPQPAGGIGVLASGEFVPCVPFPAPPGVRNVQLDLVLAPDGPVLRWSEQVRAEGPADVPLQARGWRDGRVLRWRLAAASQSGFPADPAAVWSRMRTGMASRGAPLNGPDILIGAVAAPFWQAPSPTTRYADLRGLERQPPWWFPAAWYQFLRSLPDGGQAAAEWLAWLDRLAADGAALDGADGGAADGWQVDWSSEDGAAHLALRQIQLHAGAIADACRGGALPGNAWYAWRDGAWPYPVPLEAFPPGFISAWTRLPAGHRPGTGQQR